MSEAALPVAIEPERDPHLVAAVESAGGRVVELDEARVLVWIGGAQGFPELADTIEWVALKVAGIEEFVDADILDDRRIWTNAAGFYAENVAEHALALLLAGVRQINTAVADQTHGRPWQKSIDAAVGTIRGSTVGIVGAGGIGDALIPRLHAGGAQVYAVNRSGRAVPGAEQTVSFADFDGQWEAMDHVILAAPATPETHHLINDDALARMAAHTWIVNVARGPLIDEAALHRALVAGAIAGAALDVTDPEPPDPTNPLWSLPNVILTPHVANPSSGLTKELAPWLARNIRHFLAGEEMLAVVPVGRGY